MNNIKNHKVLRSNSEDFWKKHCTAVPALIKSENLELTDLESITANASSSMFKVVSDFPMQNSFLNPQY